MTVQDNNVVSIKATGAIVAQRPSETMSASILITEHLSSEQWHELYHYMGSRALHASEFFGRELRKGHLSASGRELILERMLNEMVRPLSVPSRDHLTRTNSPGQPQWDLSRDP